ncbi:MAG: T9SS type A sorting domain-containing protein [Bacteroidota bacterium]|jgi:hypothetical protein
MKHLIIAVILTYFLFLETYSQQKAHIQYTDTPIIVWKKVFKSGYNFSDSKVIRDKFNNLVVSGLHQNGIVTIEYSSEGNKLWDGFISGANGNICSAVDDSGNVFIFTSVNLNKFMLIKYNPNGIILWSKEFNDLQFIHCTPSAISLGRSGDVYVTGTAWIISPPDSPKTREGYITLKYDRSGTIKWHNVYNGSRDSADIATALCIDGDGNVHVTGYGYDNADKYEYSTIKYDTSGSPQWIAHHSQSGSKDNIAEDIVFSSTGLIYVSGRTALICYSANGNELWVEPISVLDTKVILDRTNNIIVIGSVIDSTSYNYIMYGIKKYDSQGGKQWSHVFDGPLESNMKSDIVVDRKNNIYAVGTASVSTLFPSLRNPVIVKYDSAGNKKWFIREKDFGTSHSFVLDSNDDIYISYFTQDSLVTIKYQQIITQVDDNNHIVKSFGLFQNYPNPFNPTTTISFGIPVASFVSIKIFDMLGREVSILVNEQKESGYYEYKWNAGYLSSGIYFCQMTAVSLSVEKKETFNQTKKLLLSK